VYAEYEGSNYDNPFEIDRSQPVPSDGNGGGENGQYVPVPLVSYSDLHRFKARVRAGLTPALKIVGTFLRYDIDNKVRSSGLTSNRFSLTGTFRKRRLSAYAAYTRTDIHNTATKMITTIGPLASSFEWAAIDKADINGLLGGVTVEPRKDLTLGFRTDIQDNSGTYALGVREYEAFARITCSAGYGIRLAYMRRRYNEDRADTNDYGANIFTVGVGYEFGKQEKK
jgi:hypothetical protein